MGLSLGIWTFGTKISYICTNVLLFLPCIKGKEQELLKRMQKMNETSPLHVVGGVPCIFDRVFFTTFVLVLQPSEPSAEGIN